MKTILVVDDMAVFREPIAAALRQKGYTVLCAGNGREALKVMHAQRPDLILLDVTMPEMDGLTMLATMRADPRFRELPVILLTAVADRGHIVKAAQWGVTNYLLKSQFSLKELLDRVARVLAGGTSVAGPPAPKTPAASPKPAPTAAAPPSLTPRPTTAAPADSKPPASHAAPRHDKTKVLDRISRTFRLEGMPPVVQEVWRLANSPRTSLDEIANAIRMDQVLAIRVMKVANSSFYATGKPVHALTEATQRIGLSGVRNVASAVVVIEQFAEHTAGGLIPQRFWEHGMAVAVIAQGLATLLELESPERLFLAGLVHDIGRLVLSSVFPDDYRAVLNAAARPRGDLDHVEHEAFGLGHVDVTREVLRQWKLPAETVDATVLHHESPDAIRRQAREPRDAFVVALANGLAHGLAMGDSGDARLLDFREHTRALDLRRDQIEQVIRDARDKTEATQVFYASQSDKQFRDSYVRELAASAATDVRAVVVAGENGADPLELFCGQLGWLHPQDPQIAVLSVRLAAQFGSRFQTLCGIEERLGRRLPILIAAPDGDAAPTPDLLAGRTHASITLPARYAEIVAAIAQLAPQAEEKAGNAAAPAPS